MPARVRDFLRSPTITIDPRWDRVPALESGRGYLDKRPFLDEVLRVLPGVFCRIGLLIISVLGQCTFAHAYQFHLLQYEPNPSFQAGEALAKLRETPSWEFLTSDWIEIIQLRMKSHSGPSISLEGKVLDAAGNPVSNALIVLRQAQASVAAMPLRHDVFAIGWTDAKGIYVFDDLATPQFELGVPTP